MTNTIPAPDRFWPKVRKTETCWLWTGGQSSGGYGSFTVEQVTVKAHRYAYEQLVGPIPDGLQLDHLCRVRQCVNPAHLEPVTQKVNMLRGEGVCARFARATYCDKGHELPPRPPGAKQRRCMECNRAWHAANRARRNALRREQRASQ